MKPLANYRIVECSSSRAVALAGLRLAQLGACVVRIFSSGERQDVDPLIHRGKMRLSLDPSEAESVEYLRDLVDGADAVVTEAENAFSATLRQFAVESGVRDPCVVLGLVSSLGDGVSDRQYEAQDLLIQALSGLPWLNGNGDQPPTPLPLPVADILAGNHLVQGVLAALVRREVTQAGAIVEVSLLESLVDFQFEVLTTYLNDGGKRPERCRISNAHAFLSAPYGIHRTAEAYIAIAMGSIPELGRLLRCPKLEEYRDADSWCAPVQDWGQLLQHEGFRSLAFLEQVNDRDNTVRSVIRCPIRLDQSFLNLEVGEKEVLPRELPRRTRQQSLAPSMDTPDQSQQPTDGLPLRGLLVLDFSQFLSGPSAALRLADLGARVIKIERPKTGDICRTQCISNLELDGDSTLFHSINRNKESFAVDLKEPNERSWVLGLIRHADVIIENFRPGVMQRLGLDYESVRSINPGILYGSITGYGNRGPWLSKPGQDLLVQSLSGLVWLNGNASHGPLPTGLAIVDMLAGIQLVQGLLAGLLRRSVTGAGAVVEVSLMESALDLQSEPLARFISGNDRLPVRGRSPCTYLFMPAPYGVYPTGDGYIAIGSAPLARVLDTIGCPSAESEAQDGALSDDQIRDRLSGVIRKERTHHWLGIFHEACIPSAPVLDWHQLTTDPLFTRLRMVQEVFRSSDMSLLTTRCPIRLDGSVLTSPRGSPKVGQDTDRLLEEFKIAKNCFFRS